MLEQIVKEATSAPAVVGALLERIAPYSIIDVGSGVHGPVGQCHMDAMDPGVALHCLDRFKVRDMPPRWRTHVMDMRKMIDVFGPNSFDWIQAFDTIEHISKEDGLRWIAQAKEMARKAVLIFCPTTSKNADGFVDNAHGEAYYPDNPYQKHLSGWTLATFSELDFETASWGPGYLFALWQRV